MLINPVHLSLERTETNCLQGISLSVDQYQALLKAIPAINAQLREAGIAADDPESAGPSEEGKLKPKLKAQHTAKSAKKSNIEATSDEDSE